VGEKIAEVLKSLFAKRSLGFNDYCDFCDSLVNSSDNFQTLRRLAFAVLDLNADERIDQVDVVAFDACFG
jgi:hypothetical protein